MRTRAASIIIGLAKILTGQVASHLGGVAAQMTVNVVLAVLEPFISSKLLRSDDPGNEEASGTPVTPTVTALYVPPVPYVLFLAVRIRATGVEQLEVMDAGEDSDPPPSDP